MRYGSLYQTLLLRALFVRGRSSQQPSDRFCIQQIQTSYQSNTHINNNWIIYNTGKRSNFAVLEFHDFVRLFLCLSFFTILKLSLYLCAIPVTTAIHICTLTILHFSIPCNNRKIKGMRTLRVPQYVLCVHIDWIEQCFTSLPTQYRLYWRRVLQVKRPNQQYQRTGGKSYKGKPRKSKKQNTHAHMK